MEVKPGYKQTEVGVIPEDWELKPLKGRISIAHGFPFASEHFANHGPYRLTTPGHFYEEGGFRDIGEKQKFYVGQVPDNYVLHPGDLIVAMTEQADGLLGSAAIIPEIEGYLHNQRLGRIKVLSTEIELGYLFFVFNSASYRAKVHETAAGTKVKHTSPEKLLEISVRLPPLPEQRAIAEALSDVDSLLCGLDQLIAKKRDLKQAAMQQLLTGQNRLPDFHGEWKLIKLGELCDYVDGIATSGGDQGYLEIGDVNVETKSYDVAHKEKLSVRGAVEVPAGTLLISTVRPTRGAIVITKSSLHVSNAFCRVRPVNELMFHLVCQPNFLAYLGENSIGGTYPTCRDETILGYGSLLPKAPAEQTAIAEVLTDMDAELAALEQRRAKIHALKQGMMQELLTGKTRLI
jgi:type I restriction enzyme S subunit